MKKNFKKIYIIEIRKGANGNDIFKKIKNIKLSDWDFTTTNYGIFKTYLTTKEYSEYLKSREFDNFEVLTRKEFLNQMK